MSTPIAGLINAKAYASIQAAVDACESTGGSVFIPAGTYDSTTTPSFTGVVLPDNVSLRGAGPEATVLDLTGQSTSINGIEINGNHTQVQNLAINGQGAAGTGFGVYVNPLTTSRFNIWLDGVIVSNSPSYALRWKGTSSIFTIFSGVKRCRFYQNKGDACAYISGAHTTLTFEEAIFSGDGYSGAPLVTVEGCVAVKFRDCVIEPQTLDCPGLRVTYLPSATWSQLVTCDNCWFEGHLASDTAYYHVEVLDANANTILRDCYFARSGAASLKARIMNINPAGSAKPKNVAIDGAFVWTNWPGAETIDDITSSSAQNSLSILNSVVWNAYNGAIRPIEIGGTAPSYLSEFNNGWRFALPNLTTDERNDLTPRPGLMVYNASDGKFQGYAQVGGTGWKDLNP